MRSTGVSFMYKSLMSLEHNNNYYHFTAPPPQLLRMLDSEPEAAEKFMRKHVVEQHVESRVEHEKVFTLAF